MKVWIIVGTPNTGKSSIIRCLTGIRNGDVYQIENQAGSILNTLVIPSALQETYNIGSKDFVDFINKPKPTSSLPEDIQPLAKRIQNKSFDNLVICLHPNSRLEGADSYIDVFNKTSGWVIADPIITLNQSYTYSATSTKKIIARPSVPSNKTAHDIRDEWKWA